MAQHEIKINLPGLLKMLGSNIYAEPDVAVREMIQNAHDTCIIRKTKDRSFDNPEIQITSDKARQTLTFSDNGAGMTEAELHKYLATIGEGLTKVEKEQLRNAGVQEALLLIGQFGIGLLSAYSVADKVEVLTKSFQRGAPGLRWTCEGDKYYSVEPINLADIGTQVILSISDQKLALLDEERLQQAIKRYADFLSVPIYLNGKRINSGTPLWLKKTTDAEYAADLQLRYKLLPITLKPFRCEHPLNVDGLLFVPLLPFELTRDFGEVDIYVSRMFIKANDKELLPTWARFVKGIINTPDLTPTISRDALVRDSKYELMRDLLGQIILDHLTDLAKNDPDTLEQVVSAYNHTMKAQALNDEAFFDRICDLVRVSTDSGNLAMQAYLQQSGRIIYYFAERGMATQHKLLFAQKDLPVIDASWGVEEEFLEKYAARKGVKLERLEAGSSVIFTPPDKLDEQWQDLERTFKQHLRKEAKAVAFDPPTVPAVLVARPLEREDKAMGAEMGNSSANIAKMFQKMRQTKDARAAGDDTLVHLNTKNPLMQQLCAMHRNPTFYLALTAIYHNAILFAQHYVTPENAETIFATNNETITTMIMKSCELEEAQTVNAKMEIELNELKRKMEMPGSLKHGKQQELEELWKTISKKLLLLQKSRIIETRPDEILRVDYEIQPLETKRQKIEQQLEELSKGD